jgi:hypothetical protein
VVCKDLRAVGPTEHAGEVDDELAL